ncbi:MAG: hypothetical protein HY774_02425 [Acidobacteria bacterium]|nr:hypothetical protein [Acidobacteriota bacterium]
MTDDFKVEVTNACEKLIEELKPKHIKEPPVDATWNYITNLYLKWHQRYLYFCAEYTCPSPNAMAPTFESRFARWEYVGDNRFNLAYLRHTGQWFETHQKCSLDQCLNALRTDPLFFP